MADNYYNSIAPGYDALYAYEQMHKIDTAAQHLLVHFPVEKSTRVLDVGCGTGLSSDYWADTFECSVTGIDPADKLIAQNNKNKTKFIVGNAENLPFPEGTFDIVVSFSAILNFNDIEKGLREMRRVGRIWFVFSTLTNAPNFDVIVKHINDLFHIEERITAKKETIFICKSKDIHVSTSKNRYF